jgi:hypothetical protein
VTISGQSDVVGISFEDMINATIRALFGDYRAQTDAELRAIEDDFELKKDVVRTERDLGHWMNLHATLTNEIIKRQRSLRKRIFGETFWILQTIRRRESVDICSSTAIFSVTRPLHGKRRKYPSDELKAVIRARRPRSQLFSRTVYSARRVSRRRSGSSKISVSL